MVRASAIAIASAGSIHLLRFGYSTSLWWFLALTVIECCSLAYGDEFGFFNYSTGWFFGTYVDEPTPPSFLKGMRFAGLIGACIIYAVIRC